MMMQMPHLRHKLKFPTCVELRAYVFDMGILMYFRLIYNPVLMYILFDITRTVHIYCALVVYYP